MVLTIEEIKEKIRPICEVYKIKKACLFGSYARGEATEESDVDIYIEAGKGMRFLQFCGFRVDLEKCLDKEVDVITCTPMEFEIFKKNIEREMLLLYENNRKRCLDVPLPNPKE